MSEAKVNLSVFQKRPLPFDSVESLAVKRQRLTEQRVQQQPTVNVPVNSKGGHDGAAPTLGPSIHTKADFQRTSNQTDQTHGGFSVTHKLSSSPDAPVAASEDEPDVRPLQPPQGDSDCPHQKLAGSQHRKKKPKKHKDKERERLKDDWLDTSPHRKQGPDKLDGKTFYK